MGLVARFTLVPCMSSDALPPLLLVEDGPLTLLSTKAALEEEGYPVVAVRHGAVALAALVRPFRGLITDIRLPGSFDGWRIAREARSRWPDIPVMYVTGEGEAGWADNKVPGSLILHKPYTRAKLLEVVEKLVGQRAAVHR